MRIILLRLNFWSSFCMGLMRWFGFNWWRGRWVLLLNLSSLVMCTHDDDTRYMHAHPPKPGRARRHHPLPRFHSQPMGARLLSGPKHPLAEYRGRNSWDWVCVIFSSAWRSNLDIVVVCVCVCVCLGCCMICLQRGNACALVLLSVTVFERTYINNGHGE